MSDAVPGVGKQETEALLNDVDKIAPVLRASGASSEELSTLSPDAVTALRTLGTVNLRHCYGERWLRSWSCDRNDGARATRLS
jgi:hypothetical protein